MLLRPMRGAALVALEQPAKPAMHGAASSSFSARTFLTTSTLPPGIAAANDPTSPSFGAFAPTHAQQAIISLAQRSRLKRGPFRPMLSRLGHPLAPRPGAGP